MATLIKGGEIFTSEGMVKSDILLSEGKVRKIAEDIPEESGMKVIDARGLTIIPGLTDLHVHFREPGFEYKETIRGGSEAAVAGGFTTVCTMPNLNPAPDNKLNLELQLEKIREQNRVQIIPFATITRNRHGEETLMDYSELASDVAGFSDDGSGVQSEDVMRAAMKRIAETGKILAAHCEVDSLIRGGCIHDGDYAHFNNYKGICSESEWREIERDIRLAKETGVHLHICHISTAEGVELIRRAKRDGVNVTCETAPHYLWFTDEDLKNEGKWKMNPPLRSEHDRRTLRHGLMDGTIDAIATDHAPHTAEEKSKGLEGSAMGIVGLEVSFPASYTMMVLTDKISFSQLVAAMSINPRKILGLKGFESGGISEGDPAMLTAVDLNEKRIVSPEEFKGKGRATPFEGMELQGWPKFTIVEWNV